MSDEMFPLHMGIFPDEQAYEESKRAAAVGKFLIWFVPLLIGLGAGVAVWATNRDIFH